MGCVVTTQWMTFCVASIKGGGKIIDHLLTKFEVGRRKQGRRRLCGKQFDKRGHDVLIDVTDNTKKIPYIDLIRRAESTGNRSTEERNDNCAPL